MQLGCDDRGLDVDVRQELLGDAGHATADDEQLRVEGELHEGVVLGQALRPLLVAHVELLADGGCGVLLRVALALEQFQMAELGVRNELAVENQRGADASAQRGGDDEAILALRGAELLLGQTGGVIGETSALALLAGGVYLLWRKVITINIPAAYILTVAVITFLFPLSGDVSRVQWMLSQVLSGGLMLGAIFMATDYVTSPVTPKGQIIFGVGCGLLTVFIRYFGGLPEGVSYSILIMNTLVWAIDKKTHPRKFGYQLDKAKKEAQ